jgi:acetyl esterase/lipase
VKLSNYLLIIGIFLLTLVRSATAEEPKVEVLRNREYVQREAGPLGMDVYLPPGAGPFPGVLVVHGGAWTMGTRSQLATIAMSLAKNGYTAAAISYRLAPKYTFPAQIYDCQAAVRWMRSHAKEIRLDPAHLGGFGYSAGGHLVALLGTLDDDDYREEGVPKDAPSARLQAVMAGGAPCDFCVLPERSERLAYWLGGTRADKPDAYRDASPVSFITADDPPMFFFHGAQDLLVPIASPRRMVSQLTSAGVTAEMYTVQNEGHIQAIFDTAALEHARAFADHYLKPMTAAGGEDAPARSLTESERAGPRAPSAADGRAPNSEATNGAGNGQ